MTSRAEFRTSFMQHVPQNKLRSALARDQNGHSRGKDDLKRLIHEASRILVTMWTSMLHDFVQASKQPRGCVPLTIVYLLPSNVDDSANLSHMPGEFQGLRWTEMLKLALNHESISLNQEQIATIWRAICQSFEIFLVNRRDQTEASRGIILYTEVGTNYGIRLHEESDRLVFYWCQSDSTDPKS